MRPIRRVAFLGSPAIAVPSLNALDEAGYEIPLVVSGPDRRRGRGSATSPTPVKAVARERGITVSSEVDDLLIEHASAPIDLAVVVAFGQIIRPHVLAEIPMINVHFSRLPRWRGAAPVERAILAGDDETAVSVISVAEGLDEGDVWAEVPIDIANGDTLESLWEHMSVVGAQALVDTLAAMAEGVAEPTPQSGEVTYAAKLTAEDRRLDWDRTAAELDRIVRLGDAWTTFRGERFKIHRAEPRLSPRAAPGTVVELDDHVYALTADGALRLEEVQPAGKPRMPALAWVQGAQPVGVVLGG